eukprot:Gb_06680 [translate_table: standard]
MWMWMWMWFVTEGVDRVSLPRPSEVDVGCVMLSPPSEAGFDSALLLSPSVEVGFDSDLLLSPSEAEVMQSDSNLCCLQVGTGWIARIPLNLKQTLEDNGTLAMARVFCEAILLIWPIDADDDDDDDDALKERTAMPIAMEM